MIFGVPYGVGYLPGAGKHWCSTPGTAPIRSQPSGTEVWGASDGCAYTALSRTHTARWAGVARTKWPADGIVGHPRTSYR
jgi:hypothetical protein